MTKIPNVLDDLTEEEAYLYALLTDESGIDQCEFSVTEPEDKETSCFRCWPFQWAWWRCNDAAQIDRSGRSVGKSMSIEARAYAFPFVHGGDEMVITAPEGVHLDAITDRIETMLEGNRLTKELLKTGRGGIKHRPFHVNFSNGARIMGRIPQHNGKGVKGCLQLQAPVLTRRNGFVKAGDLVVGDELLNDQGKWTKVRKLIYDTNDCYLVEGAGSYPVEVSCDHRFLGASNLGTLKTKRDFSAGLYYNDVEFLLEDQFYWASPTEFPHVDPVYPDFSSSKMNICYDVESEDFWWLVGLYAADGYLRISNKSKEVSRVNWVSHPDNKGRKKLIRALENLGCRYRITERSHSSADQIEWASIPVARWLEEHFGRTAITKHLPTFMLSLPESFKEAFLDGYLMGDGHYNEKKNRWECSSASKELMMMIQLIAQSIGLKVGATHVQPKVTHTLGTKLKKRPETAWRLHISLSGHAYELDGYFLGKVKKVTPIGKQPIVNILVEEGQSYLGGTIMNHNIHPIWLELDEAQDYPEAGWIELLETLKNGEEGAVWRAHGVTRGVPDRFQQYTAPDSGWTVHKFAAVHRPNWTEEERKQKVKKYGGSEDNVDFRRNVYGFHGDASNPIFVLSRLMACVDKKNGEDDRPASKFNEDYYKVTIDGEQIKEKEEVLDFINLAPRKGIFWIGADIGYTTDPTEILIFEEDNPGIGSKLSLVARIQLRRVNAIDQAQVVLHLLEMFNPVRFSMDKTGNGLPLLQVIQGWAEQNPKLNKRLEMIEGFNFSGKVLFELDDSVEVNLHRHNLIDEAGIERKVLECSTDVLRDLVDQRRLVLPYDSEVILEFSGENYTLDKSTMDMYGRSKRVSKGSFHTLDAARMAALGWQQFYFKKELERKTRRPGGSTGVIFL